MTSEEYQIFQQLSAAIRSGNDIETVMSFSLTSLKVYIPADRLDLHFYDASFCAMRTIATATSNEGRKADRLTPMSHDARELILKIEKSLRKKKARPTVIINDSESDPVAHLLTGDISRSQTANMTMFILVEDRYVGYLSLLSYDGEGYAEEHAAVFDMLRGPFSEFLNNNKTKYLDIVKDINERIRPHQIEELKGPLISDGNIIGENFELSGIMETTKKVAILDNSVLILGETGVGKEVIAEFIHQFSPRRDGPFISVNCGAIPETLIDDELFGHEKGAFTGAVVKKPGRFERAKGGTIFLDEIGELPLMAQARLLRVLQNKHIERVGGSESIPVDIRVIAATHRNLEAMIREKTFRKDLWFRINIFPITIPPLRERKNDIPSLVQFFIKGLTQKLHLTAAPTLVPGAIDHLMTYDWPGNIRQLENEIERAIVLKPAGPLSFDHLGADQPGDEPPTEYGPGHKSHSLEEIAIEYFKRAIERNIVPKPDRSLNPDRLYSDLSEDNKRSRFGVENEILPLDEIVSRHIKRALEFTDGQINGKRGAAELIGINPSTFRSKMKRLGICWNRSNESVS